MQYKQFSSVQLMLTLFVLSLPIILMQNYYAAFSDSFVINIIALAVEFAVALLYFVPSLIIKNKTGLDFHSFALRSTPSGVVFTAAFYAIYFVYIIEYFLLMYIDVFKTALNPYANGIVVAGLMLSAAFYAAHRGIRGVTRCGIFVFAFAIISFVLFFLGNIFDFNFAQENFNFSSDSTQLMTAISSAMTFSFVAIVFTSVCGSTKRCKIKHIVITIISIVLLCAVSMFFIWFVLAGYGKQQICQMFLLSKSSHFGFANGIDSFFLSLITLSVFTVLSVALICIGRASASTKKGGILLLFALIAFVLLICAEYFETVKNVLLSSYVFNVLTFIGAVLIPTIYIVIFRRRLNV